MAETIFASYICGVQLSPDMTWEMLGSDFTVESDDSTYSKKTMRFPVALTTRASMSEESLSKIASNLGILQAIPKYHPSLSRTMIWINLMFLRSLLQALS